MLMLTACGLGNNDKATEDETRRADAGEVNEEDMDETNQLEDEDKKEAREIPTEEYPQLREGVDEDEIEAIMTTNMGEIHFKLFPKYAPLAVENFVSLSKSGYYDGITFHRVIEDFMIQAGDPTGTGAGGQSVFGEPFQDEFTTALAHFPGALSMANAGPNTNSSQFFIVQFRHENVEDNEKLTEEYFQYMELMEGLRWPEKTKEKYLELGGTPHLDFNHTVFGQVIKGMDVVDKIAQVPVDDRAYPLEEVFIQSIEIID